jgi:siroheme synthase
MPKKTLRELSERAVAHGLDASTPAVAVANATRVDETVIAGTIGDIAERIETDAPDGPLLVMIGKVVAEVAETEAPASSEDVIPEAAAGGYPGSM